MNRSAFSLIRKNKLRLLKGLLRHSWQPLLAAFLTAVFMTIYMLENKTLSGILPLLRHQRQGIFLLAALICFVRIFLVKAPVFKLHGAAVLYSYGSPVFPRLLRRKQRMAFFLCLACALLVTLLFHGPSFSLPFWLDLTRLTAFFAASTQLAWIFYHQMGSKRFLTLPVFGVLVLLFFWPSPLSPLFLLAAFAAIWWYADKRLFLNLPKYYDQLCFQDAALAAQSQNNLTEMLRLARENRPSTVHGITLGQLHPTHRTVLVKKSLLDLLRTQRQILFLLAALLLACGLLHSPLLKNRSSPFYHPFLSLLFVLFATMAFQVLFQTASAPAKRLLELSKAGLLLPYNQKQIFFSYLPVPMGLCAALTLLLDGFAGILSLQSLWLWLWTSLCYALSLFAVLFSKRQTRLLKALSGILLLSGILFHSA